METRSITNPPILTLIRGIPGSGKSTIAQLFVAKGAAHFEADMFFEQSRTYIFDGTKLQEAHQWCVGNVEEALKNGRDVVVSNTFITKRQLYPYTMLANKIGAAVRIIVATGRYPNVHGVPDSTIEKMLSKWEKFP